MEIRTGSISFSPLRGSGPRAATSDVHFAREVENAACGLVGYSIGFDGADHHIGLLDVRLDSEIDGDLVRVTGTLGLRDWSGNWDDNYDGVLEFAARRPAARTPRTTQSGIDAPEPSSPSPRPRQRPKLHSCRAPLSR